MNKWYINEDLGVQTIANQTAFLVPNSLRKVKLSNNAVKVRSDFFHPKNLGGQNAQMHDKHLVK